MSPSSKPASLSARSLPSGTVTFAFTDIEGSTVRWERDRAAMEDAVRRHDALMRTAITRHDGHVFKTIGDAFCAAFSRPEDAVAAMLAAQRALQAEDFSAVDGLRVRAAISTGTADERDGDYFGPAVNRVARLLATGHGGQVLLARASADLVHGSMPARAALRDLGEHRLKDIAQPEHVYQLTAPDLVADFPPLRSLDAVRNNLPAMSTSFVGREREVAEIRQSIAEHRLVTLVGSGGIGKTRTSLHVAATLVGQWADGVWFIELSPLSSGEYIVPAIAQAMAMTLPHAADASHGLVAELKSKQALLVFDNCEHLVEPAARLISAILRGCANVKIIASSREPLDISGEAIYRMPSLGVPTSTDTASATALGASEYAAVTLFVERARAADSRFQLTDVNAATVADICRRLDGIPLAIELAASRIRMLSPLQLRERLDKRFLILTGGSRDAMPRQQTLRALIDWSHDLLSEREQTLFRRLGIFVSDFSFESAAAVGSGDPLDEADILDLLTSLVEKSLVLADLAGETMRYRLLESTRAYAHDRLMEAGELHATSKRHLQTLRVRFGEAAEQRERTFRNAEIYALFSVELDDVRAALDFALNEDGIRDGAELLAAIDSAWGELGLEGEGRERVAAFAASGAIDSLVLRSRLYGVLSNFTSATGDATRALEAARQAVTFAREGDISEQLAAALVVYATTTLRAGQIEEADAAFAEAAALPIASDRLRLRLIQGRAFVSGTRGDLDEAARAFEYLVDECRARGNENALLANAGNLAEIEHERGRTHRAITIVNDILPGLRASTVRLSLALNLMNLAGFCVAIDDLTAAKDAARSALRELATRYADSALVAASIEHLGLTLALEGDDARAVRLAGFADKKILELGYERQYTEKVTRERLRSIVAERLNGDVRERLFAEGASLAPAAAIALALEEP